MNKFIHTHTCITVNFHRVKSDINIGFMSLFLHENGVSFINNYVLIYFFILARKLEIYYYNSLTVEVQLKLLYYYHQNYYY